MTRWIDDWSDDTTSRWLVWWHEGSVIHLKTCKIDDLSDDTNSRWLIWYTTNQWPTRWPQQPMTHLIHHQSVSRLMTPLSHVPHDDTNGLMAHLMTPSIFDSYDDNQSIIYLRTPRIDNSSDDTISLWLTWWQPVDYLSEDTTDR